MERKDHLILIQGEDKSESIDSIIYNEKEEKYLITYLASWNNKVYNYKKENVEYCYNPFYIGTNRLDVYLYGDKLSNVQHVSEFQSVNQRYYYIEYGNDEKISVEEKCIVLDKEGEFYDKSEVHNYLAQVAKETSFVIKGKRYLYEYYMDINLIGKNRALSLFTQPNKYLMQTYEEVVPIFPFGCNKSQYKAVKNALENQLSVIEGPPGTGKTQTILNIIANLLIQNKTIQIVSNNNDAITNIVEKITKYELDFMVALLGSNENKDNFYNGQKGRYPDFIGWEDVAYTQDELFARVNALSLSLQEVYEIEEAISKLRLELEEVQIEQKYFQQYFDSICKKDKTILKKKFSSQKYLKLWMEARKQLQKEKISLFSISKLYVLYGVSTWKLSLDDFSYIVDQAQCEFYRMKISEVSQEIAKYQGALHSMNASSISKELTELSMTYLKSHIKNKFSNRNKRPLFQKDNVSSNAYPLLEEYPIVLSSTFSSYVATSKTVHYDYLIMDEASQVDIATGALSLYSAKNAVIVGDTKQLPNVITKNKQKILQEIFETYEIDDAYASHKYSFLESMIRVFPDIPKTLLKEHYRCHPKIINYCNKQFYNDELVVMTPYSEEVEPLILHKSVVGNHARGYYSQRQIDMIKDEILVDTAFAEEDICIISPFNAQVNELGEQITTGVDASTVHKYQGREKPCVILSTVVDRVNYIVDKANLLNVAISRAKDQLHIVVTGNELEGESNIKDLVNYIEYTNGEVRVSKIYSVFDYLYKQYHAQRKERFSLFPMKMEHVSEKLMFVLLEEILGGDTYKNLNFTMHMSLKNIIRDTSQLTAEELKYMNHHKTHVDFVVFDKMNKKIVLVIEVDGYRHHKKGTIQFYRDIKKNSILDKNKVPYLRLMTNHSQEKQKIVDKLEEVYCNNG